VSPETGEILVWDVNGGTARRKSDGRWVFGMAAVPTAYELKDNFEPLWDADLSSKLVQEARAAFVSSHNLGGQHGA
jgi:hypothetical protein